ncbi:MAG: HEAT repeat domain-containing protein [Methanolinea sp.]|nr:HEAT repeat domain-containing protein [Methanolinea sp.]
MTQDPVNQSQVGADNGALELLVEQATQSKDPHVRRYALSVLGRTGDLRLKEIFLSAFRDTDKACRAQAAAALTGLGETVVPDLVSLLSDADWRVRYRAAEALGEIGKRESAGALVMALSDEKDHVRYMAAKGLGKIGNSGAVPALVGCLGDENAYVRKAAVISLGKVGDSMGRDAIRRHRDREETELVREAIRSVLSGE